MRPPSTILLVVMLLASCARGPGQLALEAGELEPIEDDTEENDCENDEVGGVTYFSALVT
jgi:hypothetical protein